MRRAFEGLVWTAHNSRVPCVGVARAAHAEEANWEQTAGARGGDMVPHQRPPGSPRSASVETH